MIEQNGSPLFVNMVDRVSILGTPPAVRKFIVIETRLLSEKRKKASNSKSWTSIGSLIIPDNFGGGPRANLKTGQGATRLSLAVTLAERSLTYSDSSAG